MPLRGPLLEEIQFEHPVLFLLNDILISQKCNFFIGARGFTVALLSYSSISRCKIRRDHGRERKREICPARGLFQLTSSYLALRRMMEGGVWRMPLGAMPKSWGDLINGIVNSSHLMSQFCYFVV